MYKVVVRRESSVEFGKYPYGGWYVVLFRGGEYTRLRLCPINGTSIKAPRGNKIFSPIPGQITYILLSNEINIMRYTDERLSVSRNEGKSVLILIAILYVTITMEYYT